jgi:chromosome segregation protein
MEDAQDDVEEARGAVAEFRKLSDFEAVGRLSDEIQSLSKELNAALGARKELELQTQMVLVDEKEAASREIERLEKERSESEQRLENEMADGKRIDEALSALEVELLRAQEGNRALAEKKEKIAKRQLELKERIDRDYAAIRDFERKMSELEIENGKLGVRKADVEEEALSFAEHPTFESFDIKQLKERLPQIEREMQHLGSINQKALDNFGEYEREMLSIKQKADKLEEERLAVMDMIQKIEDRRSQVFLDCFNEINSNFKEMHRVLGEGEGKLELENPDKPLEGGLLLEASLRGKEIHNIDSMSGGEKTLTALAFLFAIQLFDEAPFYIFDEADAALDKENSAKLARIIARISEKNQFIGITHNDTIVKQSHQIIGVALNEQKSSVVGLRLRETQAAA